VSLVRGEVGAAECRAEEPKVLCHPGARGFAKRTRSTVFGGAIRRDAVRKAVLDLTQPLGEEHDLAIRDHVAAESDRRSGPKVLAWRRPARHQTAARSANFA
jgi:hypothetical protein